MEENKEQSANTIEIVLAACIWLTLYASEFIASYFIRQTSNPVAYYCVTIVATILLALAIPLLGSKAIVLDIQEICFYDVLVQVIGLASNILHYSETGYWILAEFILILKMARVAWPLINVNFNLPHQWPVFGPLGLLRTWHSGGGVEVNRAEKVRFFRLLGGMAVSAVLIQQAFVIAALPIPAIITVIFTISGTRRLITKLEARELEHLQTQHALGVAEGVAAARAQLLVELAAKNELLHQQAVDLQSKHTLLEQQAAELATKHAQLEQQATELASKNTLLEVLSAERAAMTADLADRNISLRDAAHDFKIPLLELAAQVDLAQGFVTDDAQGMLLKRLELGLEELRSMMGDIIEQAKVSTDVTCSPIQRLAIPVLAEFFHERFYKMAEKRGVWFATREDDFAISCNEMILRRIIANLINNAIMYNEPGSEVTLSFRRSTKAAYIRIYNTGVGIANANSEDRIANFIRLIEKIKQDRRPITQGEVGFQGHGLGLQIVRRLCQELGSTITMRSIPGVVTVFRFKVPLADS